MPAPKPLPPLELLENLFQIDSKSPSGLSWKNTQAPTGVKPGDPAGYLRKDGYWAVSIRIEKKKNLFQVHRIIYYLHTKQCPDGMYVDHIEPGSNRPENLRLATASQNMMNRRKNRTYGKKETISKYKGVCWSKKKRRWYVALQCNHKNVFVGLFEDEKEAAIAYNKAALELFGKYAKLNQIE
jgi:hypothetical protein